MHTCRYGLGASTLNLVRGYEVFTVQSLPLEAVAAEILVAPGNPQRCLDLRLRAQLTSI